MVVPLNFPSYFLIITKRKGVPSGDQALSISNGLLQAVGVFRKRLFRLHLRSHHSVVGHPEVYMDVQHSPNLSA